MQNKTLQKTMVAMILDFLMFDQILAKLEMKRRLIIRNKHGIYELLRKLPNNLRIGILENQEISRKCSKLDTILVWCLVLLSS